MTDTAARLRQLLDEARFALDDDRREAAALLEEILDAAAGRETALRVLVADWRTVPAIYHDASDCANHLEAVLDTFNPPMG